MRKRSSKLHIDRAPKGWKKRAYSILAGIVVFATTYALILPAITLDEDRAAEEPGIEISEPFMTAAEETLLTAEAEDVIVAEEIAAVNEAPAGEETTAAPEEPAEEEVEVPAAQETGTEAVSEPEESAAPAEEAVISEETASSEETDPVDADQVETEAEADPDPEELEENEPQGDPTADLESRSTWESTIPYSELTGHWNEDLVRVAQSQLGYTESVLNYVVLESGAHKGYTRYGAWYGIPYGDWCAMFVSFCLHYAGVPEDKVPLYAGCTSWVEKLDELGLVTWAEDIDEEHPFLPQSGDIIFFRFHLTSGSDHVGIVYDVETDENGSPVKITTIEGNSSNRVQTVTYPFESEDILGYARLPENPELIEESSEETAAMPAQRFEEQCGDIHVAVEADEGAFPAGTTMHVTPVESEEILAAVENAVEGEIRSLAAVDITFRSAEGLEIEPAIPVRVSLTSDIVAAAEAPAVVHVDDNGEAELVAQAATESSDDELVFDTDAFSVYVIVDHEGGTVENPRVEFHFIDRYTDEQYTAGITDGTASAPYNFVNTDGAYQTTQILKNGEALELITNPANIRITDTVTGTTTEKYFYGWYVVNTPTEDTTTLSSSTGKYTGSITYTWPENPEQISFEQAITINATDSNGSGAIDAGDTVTWTLGGAGGTGTLNSEGTAHVYLAPLYEDFYFINFHKGPKENSLLSTSLMTRKLVVFGSADTASVRIGNVVCESPDPTHQVFAGWETVKTEGGSLVGDQYYQTVNHVEDADGNLINVEIDEPPAGTGYYIDVTKNGSDVTVLELYPVFDEARWLYFNTGKSGNGATYVGAAYRLTNDERQSGDDSGLYYFDKTFFTGDDDTIRHISSRDGYSFNGWYLFANVDATTGEITNLDTAEEVEVTYLDASGERKTTTITTKAIQVVESDGTIKTEGTYYVSSEGVISKTESSGSSKLFEADGTYLRFYKALDSMTLFAKWTATPVEYKVLIWEQNADDNDYVMVAYKTLQVIAGDTVKLTPSGDNGQTIAVDATTDAYDGTIYLQTAAGADSGTTYYATVADINYLHFKEHGYDGWTSETEEGATTWTDKGVEIAGDGSTIINVYYDRNLYTLWFYLGESTPGTGTSTGYVQTALSDFTGGETVYYKSGGSYAALTQYGSGDDAFYGYAAAGGETENVYGLVDGAYVPLDVTSNTTTTYTADYAYSSTTGTSGTQYGIVDGEYVQLTYNQYTYTFYCESNNGDGTAGVNGTEYYQSNGSRVYYRSNSWRTTPSGSGSRYTGTVYTRTNSASWSYASGYTLVTGTATGNYYVLIDGVYTLINNLTWSDSSSQWRSSSTPWTYYGTQAYTAATASYTGTDRYTRTTDGSTVVADTSVVNGSYYVDSNGGKVPVTASSTTVVSYSYNGTAYNETVVVKYDGPYYKQTTVNNATYYVSTSNINYNYTNGTTNTTVVSTTTNPFEGVYTKTTTAGNYTYYFYSITARYAATIADEWPELGWMKEHGLGSLSSYSFVSWITQTDSAYRKKYDAGTYGNPNIKGVYSTMSEEIITVNDSAIPDTDGIGNTPAHIMQGRYDENPNLYYYEIYFKDPESDAYPSSPNQTLDLVSAGNVQHQAYLLFTGYDYVSHTPTTGNGSSTSYTTIKYYYTPHKGTVYLYYGLNSGQNGTLVTGGTLTGTETAYYGQTISSVVDVVAYTELAAAATPAGYTFKGWYDNPDGVGKAFNFISTAFPDTSHAYDATSYPEGITLYAVYSPIRYPVLINPNGAEIDHIDHTGASYIVGGVQYATPLNRTGDSGYNRSQATYINANYGTVISEYALNPPAYVPLAEEAANKYTGTIYYYVNTQYNSNFDGSGLPSDCRNALYMTESELHQYWEFYHDWTDGNIQGGYITGTTLLDYDTWKATYVSGTKYRAINSNESWTFLGWYKNDEKMPYNFSDPVTEGFTLTAHWRLDGGYTIEYVPEYTMPDGAVINGRMAAWQDPEVSTNFTYADTAKTEIYKQPTDLTRTVDGTTTDVTDDSVIFRGWALVMRSGSGTDSDPYVYAPMETDEDGNITTYYEPQDPYTIDAGNATNGVIYMQAIYQDRDSSDRRPKVTNLVLDANAAGGVRAYVNTSDSNDLPDWDCYPGTSAINTDDLITVDGSDRPYQIEFGDIQSSAAVHLYRYATDEIVIASDGYNFFTHPEGYFLLGFDNASDEGDYIATYPADSVIAITRDDNKTIYAVWEPMVYITFENETSGTVTFGLSSTDGSALTIVNVKDGLYDRTPLADYGNIELAAGESITLAVPYGAEKNLTVSGTNTLGTGKVLVWNTKLELVEDGTTTNYSTTGSNPVTGYSHTADGSTHSHDLATGETNNTQDFSFDETLIENEKPVVVTFTDYSNDYALILDDNYPGGGTQEYDYSAAFIATGSQVLPSTSTRVGYEFQGWAFDANATTADYQEGQTITDMTTGVGGLFEDGKTTLVDSTETRTLYAVWTTKGSAQHVYIYKNVPSPGNQEKDFTFTVNVSGKYTYDSSGHTQDITAGDTFTLAHGEYAELVSSNSTSEGYIQTVVTVYNADGTRKKDSGGNELAPVTIRAEATTSYSSGSFTDTEKITVTETAADYYTTTMSRLSQVNDTYYLKLADSTDYTTNPLDDISGNVVTWYNTDAGGTVVYTNQRQKYDIGLEKVLHSNTTAPGIFTFNASYTVDDGDSVSLGSRSVTSGTTNADWLTDIPAGAVLTITEVNDGDYATVMSALHAADEDATDEYAFTFTVTQDDTVTFDNTLKSYPVTFILVDQDGNPTINGTFNLASSTGLLSQTLPNGSVLTDLYASAENNTGLGAGVFYTSDAFYVGSYTLTQLITKSGYHGLTGDAEITVTGTGIESMYSTEYLTISGNTTDGFVITVINRPGANVSVTKLASGTSTRLSGAEFTLYSDSGHTTVYNGIEDSAVVSNNHDTLGNLNLGWLPDGTYYLVETKAPAGYNPLAEHIEITVDSRASTPVTAMYGTNEWTVSPVSGQENSYNFPVYNTPGYELPSAGGVGKTPYTMGGIALLLTAALVYGLGLRRRERRTQ